MKKYRIISSEAKDNFIVTLVEYELDGEKVEVSIPHFEPQSVADVELGIVNRAASEDRKLSAAKRCIRLLSDIQTDIDVEIEAR